MTTVEKLFQEIETLPIDIKTQLIEKLLESINPSQEEIDGLWSVEAEKRVEDIKNGKVKPVDGEDVFREIQRKYPK